MNQWPDLARYRANINGDPEQRRDAERGLRRILAQETGGPRCREAESILRQAHGPAPRQQSPQEVLWRENWAAVNRLGHGRLPPLLKELADHPALAACCLEPASHTIKEAIKDLGGPGSAQGQKLSLETLLLVRQAILQVPGLSELLAPQLLEMSSAIYSLRLSEAAPRIGRALSKWRTSQAAGILGELGQVPEDCRKEVEGIESHMKKVLRIKALWDEHRNRLRRPQPKTWSEAESLARDIRGITEMLREEDIPQKEAESAGPDINKAETLITVWLGEKAALVTSAEELEDMLGRVNGLNHPLATLPVPLNPTWFHKALEEIKRSLARSIACAKNPEELMAAANTLPVEAALTEPELGAALSSWTKEITELATWWDHLRLGGAGGLPEGRNNRFQLPMAMLGDVEDLGRLWREADQKEQEFQQAAKDPQNGLSALAGIRDWAESRSKRWPGHQRLLDISGRTLDAINRLSAEKALSIWNMEAYLHLISKGSCKSPVSSEERALLLRLAGLAGEALPMELGQIETWWGAWRDCLAGLTGAGPFLNEADEEKWWAAWRAKTPAPNRLHLLPGPLIETVRREETRREKSWRGILKNRIENADTPEELESIIQHLDRHKSIGGFVPALTGRARSRLVRSLAALNEWQGLLNTYALLGAPEPEEDLLAKRAELNLAARRGYLYLSGFFNKRWQEFHNAMPGLTRSHLALCMAQAWEAGDHQTVSRLKDLCLWVWDEAMEKGLDPERAGDVAGTGEILDWVIWLRLEERFSGRETEGACEQLRHYLFPPGEDPLPVTMLLEKRIGRLWEFLADTQNLPALFHLEELLKKNHRSLILSPGQAASALTGISLNAVKQAEGVLERISPKTEQPLSELSALLKDPLRQCEEAVSLWRLAQVFLSQIPFQVATANPPDDLIQTKAALVTLTDVLEQIHRFAEIDLRDKGIALQQLRVRLKALNLPLAKALIDRLDRLMPLTRLTYLGNRFTKTMKDLASINRGELFTAGLFDRLADLVADYGGKISEAGLPGGAMEGIIARRVRQALSNYLNVQAPGLNGRNLAGIEAFVRSLQIEEDQMLAGLEVIKKRCPSLPAEARFDPAKHTGFLELFNRLPPPRSRRHERLFLVLAAQPPLPQVLSSAVDVLPDWINRLAKRMEPK